LTKSRKNWGNKLTSLSCWVMGFAIASSFNCDQAQSNIVPDNTLGAESSVVTPNVNINGTLSQQIDGGAIRGTNLFHSFREFNINEEPGAYFTNPTGIENIISRVTGGNISNIQGTLGVLGNANLFLINPSGIIFGRGARLDVGGSFVATTANAIGFDNQGFFSADNPNNPPLLTVNPSAFLFNQIRTASIENNSVTIKTNFLLVRDGGQVGAGTFGKGNGGNLTVDAQNVQLIGRSSDNQFASVLGTSAERNSTGNAGSLTIKTNFLLVRDGGQVGAGTFGKGNGGNLTVDAQNVQLIGRSSDGRFPSGLFAAAESNSTGDAGDLSITTNTLLVEDTAGVSVHNLGTGTAGNMTLNARSIRLDNNSFLNANTRSTKADPNREQATININSQDLIMRRGSKIFTKARGRNVIGGNINIDSDVIAAFGNSDISADSANFRGGRVTINSQGIFGIQFREALTPENDITATGGTPSLSGTVTINTPDIDPTRGLTTLPTEPREPQLAPGCASPRANASSFIITGRGGLPDNPRESFEGNTPLIEWVTLNQGSGNSNNPKISDSSPQPEPEPIVEATGWVINDKGEVILTADASAATPGSSWQAPTDCSSPKPSS
jgi:filamentous hemagglutinin family protein